MPNFEVLFKCGHKVSLYYAAEKFIDRRKCAEELCQACNNARVIAANAAAKAKLASN